MTYLLLGVLFCIGVGVVLSVACLIWCDKDAPQ